MPYEFRVHGWFVEFRLFGVLGPSPEPITREEWELVLAMKAVLYNYDDVEGINYDPYLIAENLKRNLARGIRTAAVSSVQAWFGVNRQLQQLSDAEPDMARLFATREAAVEWLLGVTGADKVNPRVRPGQAVYDSRNQFVGVVGKVSGETFELRRPDAPPRWMAFEAVESSAVTEIVLVCRADDWLAYLRPDPRETGRRT